jgi:hypothetical protein
MKSSILFIQFFIIFSATSQISSIQTDRPDQTESSALTPVNYFQAEIGLLSEFNRETQNHYLPTALLKYGINENFELRLITETSLINHNSTYNFGFSPLSFGLKLKLTEESKFVPKISLIAHLGTAKWGSRNLHTPFISPSFRFTIQKSIGEKTNFGTNLGMEWDGISGEQRYLYTVTLSRSIGDNLGAYVESFGYFNSNWDPELLIDGGLTYLVNNDFQIDLSCGSGVYQSELNFYGSIGFSFRINCKKVK